jgi:hypothetical protein
MSDSVVTTVREALMAELLQDVDVLVRRLEHADAALAAKLEQATKDAVGHAVLAARLNFESMMDAQAGKLTEAGHHTAALIGNQLNRGAAQLIASNAVLERKARRFVLLLAVFALVAGTIGGFIGVKLAGL